MKTTRIHRTLKTTLLAGLLGGLGALNTHAQLTFDSGSDGSDGALNITTNTTLALHANGIFKYTTIDIASGATLKFTTNALNTPVYLLAQGDVTINGTIDVSGSGGSSISAGVGGPGGFGGGNPGGALAPGDGHLAPGDGHGPGGGKVGWSDPISCDSVGSGSYGGVGYSAIGGSVPPYTCSTNRGSTYGSPLLCPLVGGSGGGAGGNGYGGVWGGGGGGGGLLIASSTRIDLGSTGTLIARGGGSASWYVVNVGSGGALRLVAPVIAGSGTLDVRGGRYSSSGTIDDYGGAGRIRVDCMDRRSFALNLSGVYTIGANMVAIPTNAPHLDITQVGTNNIAVGTGAPVFFMLPQGSSTNQAVRVQASNFGSLVPIRVVLTPDNGPSSSYDTNIDNTVSPASVTVPVVVPVNVQVQVNAWTR